VVMVVHRGDAIGMPGFFSNISVLQSISLYCTACWVKMIVNTCGL
jgi:hypothetical protein